jgi:hypothetical protein
MTDQQNIKDPYEGIIECPLHPTLDGDCADCKVEVKTKNAVIDTQTDEAREKIRTLMNRGVAVPPGLGQDIRLELMIESVYVGRARLAFEAECGRRVNSVLDAATKDTAKPTLLKPGQFPAGSIKRPRR